MAKVNQNKLIGALVVAVITLVVVIVIVLIAKSMFPANSSKSSSTLLGTDTNKVYTPSTTPAITTAPPDDSQVTPPVTTTPDVTDVPVLPPASGTTSDTSPETGNTVYLNTSVYLRGSASWKGEKGIVVNKGSAAKVVRVEGDWYVLEYNGNQGYVFKDYISDTPTVVTTTPAAESSVTTPAA